MSKVDGIAGLESYAGTVHFMMQLISSRIPRLLPSCHRLLSIQQAGKVPGNEASASPGLSIPHRLHAYLARLISLTQFCPIQSPNLHLYSDSIVTKLFTAVDVHTCNKIVFPGRGYIGCVILILFFLHLF